MLDKLSSMMQKDTNLNQVSPLLNINTNVPNLETRSNRNFI